MFQQIRDKLAFRRRLGDVEETLAALEHSVEKRLRVVEAAADYLELDLKKLRGRVTGGLRNEQKPAALDGQLTFDEIDDQIRRGVYHDVS